MVHACAAVKLCQAVRQLVLCVYSLYCTMFYLYCTMFYLYCTMFYLYCTMFYLCILCIALCLHCYRGTLITAMKVCHYVVISVFMCDIIILVYCSDNIQKDTTRSAFGTNVRIFVLSVTCAQMCVYLRYLLHMQDIIIVYICTFCVGD